MRKQILWQTGIVLLGQALCACITAGIFALLDQFDRSVILGCILGSMVACANFFFMAVGSAIAANRAMAQDVKGGKATIQISYLLRMAGIFLVLLALVKSGLCHVLATVLPLVFTRPIVSISAFFQRGDLP